MINYTTYYHCSVSTVSYDVAALYQQYYSALIIRSYHLISPAALDIIV